MAVWSLDDFLGRERAFPKAVAAMRDVDGMTLAKADSHIGLSVSGVRETFSQ